MAALATLALVQLRGAIDRADATDPPPIAVGEVVPNITGTTLDGAAFDLTALRGRPVIINFWGPSCIPCREEFPLFKTLLAAHAGDGLAIVGVLMDDPPAPARDFIAEYAATWPTVDDPDRAIRDLYRVAARPVSYFVDRDGILRSIQVGELSQAEFDRKFPAITGPASNDMGGSTGPEPAPVESAAPSGSAAPTAPSAP